MKKILLLISTSLSIATAQDIYSTLKFVNKSDLAFDFSLFVKSKPSGSSGVAGYNNPAWLGKYSPNQLTTMPISFPNTPFVTASYYWTDQSFFNNYDWVGFDLKTDKGITMGLTNKATGDSHYCNFQGDDNWQTIVYSFEKTGGGYTLYAIMPSGSCSFAVTDGYGPWPPSVAAVNNDLTGNINPHNLDDGHKNADLEIQNNPGLLRHLDEVYFEATGIDRANLRAKKTKQISEQVKPFFK